MATKKEIPTNSGSGKAVEEYFDGIFYELNKVNLNDVKEKKNNLDYISWAWAWAELHKRYPEATSKVYENKDGWNYHTDGRTCWVKVGVTVEGVEHIEMLPVMDARNHSIPLNQVTSFDVNKSIQRAVTKAIARHGLGLYVYAGEDLPDEADDQLRAETNEAVAKSQKVVDADLLPGGKRYQNAVIQHATGVTAGGRAIRDIWIANAKATPEQVKQFDADVFNYKIQNNLQ